MILECITVGSMEANCYVLGSEASKQAVIIDPGDDYERITQYLEKQGLKAQIVINTHGHIDHIGANNKFKLPIYIHELDAEHLKDPAKNLSGLMGQPFFSPPAVRLLKDGDKIEIDEIGLEVIHTPGHTPGGICLKRDGIVLTGDTLFCGGIGRTDLPQGSDRELMNSIKMRLLILPDETIVYPGHGPSSTIGKEKRENPFLI